MSRLNYDITANNTDFINKMNSVRGEIQRTAKVAKNEGDAIASMATKVGATIGVAFGAAQFKELTKQIINVRGEIEALETSFKVLAGAKGLPLFEEIRKFAVETPLGMQELAKGAQTLLSFNVAAERVMPLLKQIGDISMGDAAKFNSLTLAFSQMSSTGKLMGQDLLQMINAGFNPLSVISEKTGKSIGELRVEMEKGAISADMVAEAFAIATGEGGKFNGMLAKQSEGIKGMISNLEGAYEDMLNELGTKMEDAIKGGLKIATSLVENYEKIGRALMDIVVAFGAYKAAVIAVTVATNIATAAQAGWTAAELLHFKALVLVEAAQKKLNLTMLKNPYVLIGALVAGLVVATYKLVTAKSAEEKAVDKSRKAWEKWKSETDDAKTRADELTNILKGVGTDTQKQSAWEELIRLWPEIEKIYKTRATWEALSTEEQEKALAIAREQREEARLRDNVTKAQAKYDKANKSLQGMDIGFGGAFAYKYQERLVGQAKADLDVAEKALQDFLDLQKRAKDAAKVEPKKIKNTPTEEEKRAAKEREEARKKTDEATDEFIRKSEEDATNARIEAMKDGAQKEVAIIENKFAQERAQLTEQYEALKKEYAKQGRELPLEFVQAYYGSLETIEKNRRTAYGELAGNLMPGFDAEVDESEIAEREAADHERLMKQIEDRDTYVREFGSLEERKAQVAKYYDDQIAKATSEVEKTLLKARKEAELFNLSLEKIQTTGEVAMGIRDIADACAALAEATGNSEISEVASAIGDIANVVGGMAQGFATGGWAGLIVAGVTSIIDVVIKYIEKAEQKRVEAAQNLKEQGEAVSNYFKEAVEGARSAADALDEYDKAIEKNRQVMMAARNQLRNYGYYNLANMRGADLEEWKSYNTAEYNALSEKVRINIDTIISGAQNTKDIEEQLNEKLTGIKLSSVEDKMRDALVDGAASAKDSVEDIMRDAIAQSVQNAFSDDLAEWYADFAEAMQDGTLSEAEANALRDAYQAIFDAMKAQNDAAQEVAGVADKTRSANAQAVTQASQDSIDYMNGQLTLGNHTLLSIDTRLLDANNTLSKLTQGTSQIITHLLNISRNTDFVPAIADEMRLLRTAVDNIRTQGLKMK